jgi:hypothetical protein
MGTTHACSACRRLGLVLSLGLAACSGGPSPAAAPARSSPPASAPAAGPPQLTVSQARTIFAAFLPRFDEMVHRPSLVPQLATGPEFTALTAENGMEGLTVGKLTGDRFMVPMPTSYPRWFAVAGTGSAGRGFLFVLEQQSAGAAWLDAAELYDLSVPPQIMPDLSFEGDSASSVVTPADTSSNLQVAPDALSGAYAAYLNDRANGPQRKNFAAGGYTTDRATETRQIAAGAPSAGWKYTDTQSAVTLPAYGWLLSNGSGLIVFFTRDTETWTALSPSADVSRAAPPGLPDAPPGVFLTDLGVTAAATGMRITVTAVDESLAWEPPLDSGNVTVIVNDGMATAVTKS